jgi:2-oxo-4-hydroxy-4-carboxy--5-ureidoimidazoline (OHCU) decarboxylase
VRDLPRQLTVDQLVELFEGRTRFVELLAEREEPLGPAAEEVAAGLSEVEKVEALNAHPAIGARNLSPRSTAEQGTEADAATLTELAYLNQVYEEKFGFRFVVFVDRRPKSELIPVLQERLERTREEELETGMGELVAIARDRWSSAAG